MKKLIALSMSIFMLSFIFVGCNSVNQEDYDKVIAETNELQKKLTELETKSKDLTEQLAGFEQAMGEFELDGFGSSDDEENNPFDSDGNFSFSFGGDDDNTTSSDNSSSESPASNSPSEAKTNGVVALGETFQFSGIEFTVGSDFNWVKIKSDGSDLNGKDAVQIPITMKNLKDTNNKLSNANLYEFGPPMSTMLITVNPAFSDSPQNLDELKGGETKEASLYFLYSADGKYEIVFDDYKEFKITIALNVKKS